MSENPVSAMAERLERFRAVGFALAQNWAGQLEGQAKGRAPWRDRTGHARQGLHGDATRGTGSLIAAIHLSHSVRYGVFLESPHKAYTVRPVKKKALMWNGLAHPVKKAYHPARGPIFAVIRPTIERNLDAIKRTYGRLLEP